MNQISLTIETIKKAKLYKFIFLSIFLAIICIALFILAISSLTAVFVNIEYTWLKTFLVGFVTLLGGVGGWFLFPSIVIVIAGIFQENIIEHIEKEYYPDRVRKESPKFFADLKHDIKFASFSAGINILILPLYLFGIGAVVAIAVNTYLLGREFFENVAGYHLGKKSAQKLGKQNKRIVYSNGFLFSLISIIPILNLVTPVVATVVMTHAYHKKVYEQLADNSNFTKV